MIFFIEAENSNIKKYPEEAKQFWIKKNNTDAINMLNVESHDRSQ